MLRREPADLPPEVGKLVEKWAMNKWPVFPAPNLDELRTFLADFAREVLEEGAAQYLETWKCELLPEYGHILLKHGAAAERTRIVTMLKRKDFDQAALEVELDAAQLESGAAGKETEGGTDPHKS